MSDADAGKVSPSSRSDDGFTVVLSATVDSSRTTCLAHDDAFTVAISRQEVSTAGIQVGETVPLFTAIDRHGERFDSATLGGKPTLMKFFRGHW